MKTIKKSNFRVEVYPKTHVWGFKVNEEEDVCEMILADIMRNIDSVQTACIVSDEDPVCASCGARWTEDGDTYNGGCCKVDQDAEDARMNEEICNHDECIPDPAPGGGAFWKCAKCGKHWNADWHFCRKCGVEIQPGEFNEIAGTCIHCAPCRCEDEEER